MFEKVKAFICLGISLHHNNSVFSGWVSLAETYLYFKESP